eukprot:9043248-Pyramimonas_sp.AAC.1
MEEGDEVQAPRWTARHAVDDGAFVLQPSETPFPVHQLSKVRRTQHARVDDVKLAEVHLEELNSKTWNVFMEDT